MKKLIAITIIVTIIACLISVTVICVNFNKTQKKASQEVPENNLVKIISLNLENREILKVDNKIYVGNNLKELQNDFYDIKIENVKEGADIYLNKLWYESYGADYIQDQYLAEICRQISLNLKSKASEEQLDYILYKYIKDSYLKVRKNELVQQLFTKEFAFKFMLEQNIVKLEIRGR